MLAAEVTVLPHKHSEPCGQQHLSRRSRSLLSPACLLGHSWAGPGARHLAVDLNLPPHSPSLFITSHNTSKQMACHYSLRVGYFHRDNCAPAATLPGDIGQGLKTFWVVYNWWRRWYYWHLVGRSQDAAKCPAVYRMPPHTEMTKNHGPQNRLCCSGETLPKNMLCFLLG